jgi:hypothetical protein
MGNAELETYNRNRYMTYYLVWLVHMIQNAMGNAEVETYNRNRCMTYYLV